MRGVLRGLREGAGRPGAGEAAPPSARGRAAGVPGRRFPGKRSVAPLPGRFPGASTGHRGDGPSGSEAPIVAPGRPSGGRSPAPESGRERRDGRRPGGARRSGSSTVEASAERPAPPKPPVSFAVFGGTAGGRRPLRNRRANRLVRDCRGPWRASKPEQRRRHDPGRPGRTVAAANTARPHGRRATGKRSVAGDRGLAERRRRATRRLRQAPRGQRE